MDSGNLKLFNHTVSQLYKGKSVGHSSDSTIGYLEYKKMYTKELIKLNDDELIQIYYMRKKCKYFNVLIQAWCDCINLEMKKRNLNYEI
jgi:hypothetical protein